MKKLILGFVLFVSTVAQGHTGQVEIVITEGDAEEVVELILKADQIKKIPELGVVEIQNLRLEPSSPLKSYKEFRFTIRYSTTSVCSYLGYKGKHKNVSTVSLSDSEGTEPVMIYSDEKRLIWLGGYVGPGEELVEDIVCYITK